MLGYFKARTFKWMDLFCRWTQKNVPIYVTVVSDTLKPYVVQGYDKTWEVTLFAVDYTADARNWLSNQAQSKLIWVSSFR